jgi:CheY-like chemotaxis protein
VRSSFERPPFIALIDDDAHSAYLFVRMLAAVGGPAVEHYNGEEGFADLATVLNDPFADWPDVIVLDLKAGSHANLGFLSRHHAFLRQKGIAIAVMIPPGNAADSARCYEAGASAVFFRQPDLDAYRRELAGIVSFWARHPRLDAVGM